MSQHHGRMAFLVAGLALAGLLGTGCSAISKVKQTYDNVKNNKATIDAFTQNLDNSKSAPFMATYASTGSSPATVVYAVDPSAGGLAIHLTQTGGSASNTQFIVNSSGNYSCTQSGSSWSCTKLDQASAQRTRRTSSTSTRLRTGSISSKACPWSRGWPATR